MESDKNIYMDQSRYVDYNQEGEINPQMDELENYLMEFYDENPKAKVGAAH